MDTKDGTGQSMEHKKGNTMNENNFSRYLKILTAAAVIFIGALLLFFLVGARQGPVNPADNTLDDDPEAGLSYALLYNQGDLYNNIQQNDDNLRLIQEDLTLFARSTLSELSEPDVLIGFTLDNDFTQDDTLFKHTGRFYGVDDKIELLLSVLDRGVITLSITNTEDNTNIDNSLQLNGAVNNLIKQLPIEEDFYSIRYFNSRDEIVVGFFLGYSSDDVTVVENIFKESLDKDFETANIVFSVTSVGTMTLQEIKEFQSSPDNTF